MKNRQAKSYSNQNDAKHFNQNFETALNFGLTSLHLPLHDLVGRKMCKGTQHFSMILSFFHT